MAWSPAADAEGYRCATTASNATERAESDPSLEATVAFADRVDWRIEDIFTPDDETKP